MYEALAIANYFVEKSFASGTALTPMQLVKLVYIAHGWFLARTGEPLLSEAVQAWRYGPVIPRIYHEFKQFGDGPITRKGRELEFLDDRVTIPQVREPKVTQFLDSVWEAYKGFSGVQLSTMTHQSGTPWSEVWRAERGSETRGAIIPNDKIKSHYQQLARDRGG